MTAAPGILPVMLDTLDRDSCDRHRTALATLPSYFALADSTSGAVAVVSTSAADWAARATGCLSEGATALLIGIGEYLHEDGLDTVLKAAAAAGATVAADLEYAADPAWVGLATSVDRDRLGLIDGLATTGGSLRAAAIRLVVTLGAMTADLPRLEPLAQSADHLVLGGTAGRVPVTLAAARSTHGAGQRLDLVSAAERFEIIWPDRGYAAPVLLYTHTAAGTARAPVSYQAPGRHTWLQLHALAASGQTDPGLDQLRLALRALPGPSALAAA